MSGEPARVSVDTSGAVVVATIDDGKANALSFALLDELRSVVAEAVALERPLVLAGRAGQFCAGFDLAVMRGDDGDAITRLVGGGARLFRAVLEAPVPVVAACTGHALAAGALLLLSADHRVGVDGPFKIGLNEVRIGLTLPAFAVAMARNRLDPRHLTAATVLAEIATPARAVDVGYLDGLVDDPVAAAIALAEELAALPRHALAGTKQQIRAPLVAELDALGVTPAA